MHLYEVNRSGSMFLRSTLNIRAMIAMVALQAIFILTFLKRPLY